MNLNCILHKYPTINKTLEILQVLVSYVSFNLFKCTSYKREASLLAEFRFDIFNVHG